MVAQATLEVQEVLLRATDAAAVAAEVLVEEKVLPLTEAPAVLVLLAM